MLFTRFSSILQLFVITVNLQTQSFINAAPLPTDILKRQIGDLQCNIDRIQIITQVNEATADAQTLSGQLSSDPAASELVSSITSGLNATQSGINEILDALSQGQKAPADVRDAVGEGLTQAIEALDNITTTDPNAVKTMSKLQVELDQAAAAGNAVVTDCV
ncbi:hypothetical protein C8Q75DRAFT_808065 [Abortiporus biennis]|nr:hypothetical protein C8Q75DRAFT_808065 [Abortiporus biennis]